MARLKGSAEVLDARRHHALGVLDAGRSLNEVGSLLGCAPSSVIGWQDGRARGGEKALKVRASPGRPPKLGRAGRRRLLRLLLRGALAHGYAPDLWTTARIAAVIEVKFGITYRPDRVGRLMEHLGWNHQRPERRAVESSKDRIEYWRRTVAVGTARRREARAAPRTDPSVRC